MQKRRCAPLLEHEILYNRVLLGSSDWKTVPDIWRTAAEKYADRTALIDRYHEPPLELTYKQVISFLCMYILYLLQKIL